MTDGATTRRGGAWASEEIAGRQFRTIRRGYDQQEVRQFLTDLATQVKQTRTRADQLEADLRQAEADLLAAEARASEPAEITEEAVIAAVGDEMAAILRTTHAGASELRKKAAEDAERVVAQATAEAERLRSSARAEADALLGSARAEVERLTVEATEAATALVAKVGADAAAEAEQVVTTARTEAAAMRADAERDRQASIDAAKALRERVLTDLARRRRVATVQIEQLRAGRERLLESYGVVRRTLEEVTEELRAADAQARAAAEEAGRRTEAGFAEEDDHAVGEPGAAGVLLAAGSPPAAGRPAGDPTGTGAGAAPVGETADGPVPATAEPPVGDAMVGDAVVGDAVVGDAVVGDAVVGDAVVGDAVAGDAGMGPTGARAARAGGPGDGAAPATAERPATARSGRNRTGRRPPAPGVRPAGRVDEAGPEDDANADRVGGLFERLRNGTSPRVAGRDRAPAGGAPEVDLTEMVDVVDGVGGSTPDAPAPAAGRRDGRGASGRRGASGATRSRDIDLSDSGPNASTATAAATPAAGVALADPADADDGESVARSNDDEVLVQTRDGALAELEQGLVRRLKRALQDEQNELLDRLRALKGVPDAVEVLSEPADQVERYVLASLPFITEAAAAGVEFAGDQLAFDLEDLASLSAGSVREVAETAARSIVEPIRRRVTDLFAEHRDGGAEALTESIGSVYRTTRSQRVEVAAADALSSAFTRAVWQTTPDGALLRWIAEDADGPCADCDDNALAGNVTKGEAFPTGQVHPPAHDGCRCLLVPVRV